MGDSEVLFVEIQGVPCSGGVFYISIRIRPLSKGQAIIHSVYKFAPITLRELSRSPVAR